MTSVEFTVNGKKCSVSALTPAGTSLNAYLRYGLALTGTKAMCREGGCGACVVSVRKRSPHDGSTREFSVNSCLVLVFSCHGWDITTVEGLGSRLEGYSQLQQRVVQFNATQCGYCTPGWVMQLHSLQDKHLTMLEMERAFGSNTCRCTGFRPIMDTVKSFAVDATPELCQKIKDMEDLTICKKTQKACERKCSVISCDSDDDWTVITRDDWKLKDDEQIYLNFGTDKFFKVYNEDDIFNILYDHGYDSYMLVDGNTSKGIYETFEYPRVLIDISGVKSLKSYEFDQNLILGANISLETCKQIFKATAKSHYDEFAYLEQFAEHFEKIAHIPVRNIGSLAGNLMTKHKMPSFQSDVFLLFASVRAMITLRHADNTKVTLSMMEFLNYNMRGVLMLNIELPPLSQSRAFRSYKIMPRNQNALAIVNAAFLIKFDKNTNKILQASIVYGNISPAFVHASSTEKFLIGKDIFDNKTLQSALKSLSNDINPVDKPPETSPQSRRKLAIGLFYKFILNITPSSKLSSFHRSGGNNLVRPLSHGTQDFQTHPELYPLTKPVPKYEGLIQASGEAKYANDLPPLPREVFGAFVLSTVHSGEIVTVDATEALKIEGVLKIYTAKDIPGKNSFTRPGFQLLTEDEEILASKKIEYYGQPVAIIVAETEELAHRVAKKVKVSYRNVNQNAPVLTIDQAKKDSNRIFPGGDSETIVPKGKGTNVTKIIKGVYEVGAQYHYYIEPITCVVVPVDRGVEVYESSQWMDLTQIAIAQCLGINESDVSVKVRRTGGGFGGKITRNVQAASACALVAKSMNRPCRFILPIQTNMTIAGKRLPCQCTYEVGVNDDGKIQYLNASLIEDKGCSLNENILSYTSEGFKNCYNVDYFNVKTANALTEKPTNTFMRSPGTNEGIASIEHIMEHIAYSLNKDPTDVRLANMRTEDNDIPLLIEDLKKEADYDKRCKDIEEFNAHNRWMKKSLVISVMAFPVMFYGNYSAIVTIYRGDGTVTVTTGGIEMGQGVNTKCAQVCAYELGIPLEKVSVLPHYSFTAANNVFSGSSIVSESVCFSIIKCCEILKERLEPVKQTLTNPTWKELIDKAGEELVDLTAEYMMTEKEKELGSYSAFAVTMLEVQLDCLTGRYEMLRVDILEDVGLSANPNIDVGQVEGAYIQGIGYFTSEKVIYDKHTGKILTNRSLNYHVPLASDIPVDFRVKLRYNSKNPKGVLGAKAVGEMGICTAHGITHALRRCIQASRESSYPGRRWIDIEVPYDADEILKALDVQLEEMVLS